MLFGKRREGNDQRLNSIYVQAGLRRCLDARPNLLLYNRTANGSFEVFRVDFLIGPDESNASHEHHVLRLSENRRPSGGRANANQQKIADDGFAPAPSLFGGGR
jgi:hypothetical protein